MDKTLLLIDGSSFIFRAFHAMPNLSAPDKTPTGATYGIINMLKQMLKKYDTHSWCCVFDAPGKTFRHDMYPEYKANRTETPPELVPQFKDIYEIVPALGIPVIIQPGVEADDVIGTLATKAKELGYKVLIATGDKDFAQLVDDDINLINTMSDELLDYNSVIDKFGVKPKQIVDYLALVGDKVDNVPGVDKCGPKTATKWLNEYETLENIIENADKISGVVGDNLRNSIGWLTTAKTLVTIDTHVDLSHIIPNGITHLNLTYPQNEALAKHYSRLGFKTWFRQINEQSNRENQSTDNDKNTDITNLATTIIKKTHIKISQKLEFNNIITKLTTDNEPIALVIIPDNMHLPQYIKYVFIANTTHVYTLQNEVSQAKTDLFDEPEIIENYNNELNKLFNSNIPKILSNYKDTLHIVLKCNMNLYNVIGDITLAHYLANSKASHQLSYIYKEIANVEIFDLITPKNKTSKSNDDILNNYELIISNYQKVVEYAQIIEETLKNKLNTKELYLYKDVELPLARILVNIENAGITLNVPHLKVIESEISQQLSNLENQIYKDSNCVFNLNSPKQLQDVLFNQLQLPTNGLKKNTTGYSTDEDALKTLESQGISLATLLLEYRGLSKLLNTYINKLPLLVDLNNKLHTTFEQATVASGRLSSRDPNLQNIPVKSGWGRKIRQCFIAQKNHVLICADYSQIELRILAHFSNDENLINAFNNNLDIHAMTASEIFHKPIAEVSKDERRYAKTINFSLLYGKTVFGLANELNIDRTTAKLYIDTYFAKYPRVLDCLNGIKQYASTHGYVETIYGRKIYLPNINSGNKIIREAEERVALNAPMQGTSADIIKIAMCNIDKWLRQNQLKSQIILQVHDELILHVPNDEIDSVRENLSRLMTEGFNLVVKLDTELKVANNWDEAH